MSDVVTKWHRLSLPGCKHRTIPVIVSHRSFDIKNYMSLIIWMTSYAPASRLPSSRTSRDSFCSSDHEIEHREAGLRSNRTVQMPIYTTHKTFRSTGLSENSMVRIKFEWFLEHDCSLISNLIRHIQNGHLADIWDLWDLWSKTSNISRTLVGNKIVDNSDVVGASPVGAAPTTSSFST